MQLKTVRIEKSDDTNFVLGQTHFIKSVEDIHEALVAAVPGIKFGLAFCEASGKCLVRWSGTDPALTELARKNAAAIGAGHSFLVFLGDGFYPLNVLNTLKIFQACEQEDTSTMRKYGGTGLGLTITARLVALMGGGITVDSVPGQGSTFAFTARFGLQPHSPETTAASPPALLGGLPVLIVDDNATNRHIFEEWLRGYSMEPTATADGATAMATLWHGVAQGRPYPLILLDGRMPDIDGLALAAKIRQQAELSATHIILLTSGDRPGDLTRARQHSSGWPAGSRLKLFGSRRSLPTTRTGQPAPETAGWTYPTSLFLLSVVSGSRSVDYPLWVFDAHSGCPSR